jgi:hypothetical protein
MMLVSLYSLFRPQCGHRILEGLKRNGKKGFLTCALSKAPAHEGHIIAIRGFFSGGFISGSLFQIRPKGWRASLSIAHFQVP